MLPAKSSLRDAEGVVVDLMIRDGPAYVILLLA
jgi:hypothetical protein